MLIDLNKIKRESSSGRTNVAREALKRALKEERGDEELASNIRPTTVSKKHSRRMGGIRIALRKFSGFGEITHRAVNSTTFDSAELVEKYDELMEIRKSRKERYERQQKRKEERKGKAEEIFENLVDIIEDHEDLEERFGSIRNRNRSVDGVNLKAKTDHRGINLNLQHLTVEQFERILDILS